MTITKETKKKISETMKERGIHKGEKNPMYGKRAANWKGGKRKMNGYVEVWKPKHPAAIKGRVYIAEHRLVMENFLGRYLESWEWIHHKNGIRDDNRIENLEIVIAKKHFGKIRCPKCQYEFLIK